MLTYKIDVLDELKKKGYTTYILRKKRYLSETTIANLRAGKPVTMGALNSICVMLRKNPSEILDFEISKEEKIDFFI